MDPATLAVLSTATKVIGTGASLYGAYSSYEAGKDAAKDSKQETAENIRRAQAQNRAALAETRARLAAQGLQFSGTPGRYMDEMQKEQGRQIDWTRRAGSNRARALRDQGKSDALGSLTGIAGYWS